MRISDWSSDVCSSDLLNAELEAIQQQMGSEVENYTAAVRGEMQVAEEQVSSLTDSLADLQRQRAEANQAGVQLSSLERKAQANRTLRSEERRVGKRVSVRVDLGGSRLNKKTKH